MIKYEKNLVSKLVQYCCYQQSYFQTFTAVRPTVTYRRNGSLNSGDINELGYANKSALAVAADSATLILRFSNRIGADISIVDDEMALFHYAARKGLEVVKIPLERGADINARPASSMFITPYALDPFQTTPRTTLPEAVKYLAEKGPI